MMVRAVMLGVPALVSVAAAPAGALLCQKKSGVVVARDVCKKKETPVDLANAGVQARVTGTCSAGTALAAVGGDGSATCQPAGVFAYGQVRKEATLRAASPNVIGVTKVAPGQYCVSFSNPPASSDELEGAVASLAGNASEPVAFVRVQNGQDNFICDGLAIGITDANGVYVDGRFSFVVP
jgi:hypothetical protein